MSDNCKGCFHHLMVEWSSNLIEKHRFESSDVANDAGAAAVRLLGASPVAIAVSGVQSSICTTHCPRSSKRPPRCATHLPRKRGCAPACFNAYRIPGPMRWPQYSPVNEAHIQGPTTSASRNADRTLSVLRKLCICVCPFFGAHGALTRGPWSTWSLASCRRWQAGFDT